MDRNMALLVEAALLKNEPKAVPALSPPRPEATPQSSGLFPTPPPPSSPPASSKKRAKAKRSLSLTPADLTPLAPETSVHLPPTSGRLRVTTYQTIKREEYLPQKKGMSFFFNVKNMGTSPALGRKNTCGTQPSSSTRQRLKVSRELPRQHGRTCSQTVSPRQWWWSGGKSTRWPLCCLR